MFCLGGVYKVLFMVSVENKKSGIPIPIVRDIPLFYNMSAFSFLPDYLR